METKMITLPFEVELAKKIQAGEEPGKIVTRDGRNVRVACWDFKFKGLPIVALTSCDNGEEQYGAYSNDGRSLGSKNKSGADLFLQVPECTQYKDGDAIYFESSDDSGNTSTWLAVVKENICKFPDKYDIDTHITFYMDGKKKLTDFSFPIKTSIKYVRFATDEEKKKMIDILKLSTKPQAKEHLKRFFGIEENPDCEFYFLQPVLVRANPSYQWLYGNFTHMSGELHFVSGGIGYKQCIPYTEQTKHLLGTTDNLEEQQ